MLSCPQKLPVEVKIKTQTRWAWRIETSMVPAFPSLTESCEHSTVDELSLYPGPASGAHLHPVRLCDAPRAPPS